MVNGSTQEFICSNVGCDEDVDPRRHAIGYTTCLYCGSPDVKRTITIPYNKGTYQLITDDGLDELRK